MISGAAADRPSDGPPRAADTVVSGSSGQPRLTPGPGPGPRPGRAAGPGVTVSSAARAPGAAGSQCHKL